MDWSLRRGEIDVGEEKCFQSLFCSWVKSVKRKATDITFSLPHPPTPIIVARKKVKKEKSAQLWRKVTFGWTEQIDKQGNQGSGSGLYLAQWLEQKWTAGPRFCCGCHTDVPLAAPRLAFRTSFLHPGYGPSVASAEQSCDTNGAATEGCGLPFVAGTNGCRPLPEWIISALWQRFRTGTVNLGVKQAAECEMFRRMGTEGERAVMLHWVRVRNSALSPVSRLKFGKRINPEVRSGTDECEPCGKEVRLMWTWQMDIRSVQRRPWKWYTLSIYGYHRGQVW